MPTSKDILATAKKALEESAIVPQAYSDMVSQMTTDIAAFAKAKAEISTGVNSMKGSIKIVTENVKDLNKALTDLQKNKAVMLAPADAKAYEDLCGKLKTSIAKGIEWEKKMADSLAKAQSYV